MSRFPELRALPRPERGEQALPSAGATRSFVLIVTNKRSLELGRPDLQYADDDAAKYYELFRMATPAAQVQRGLRVGSGQRPLP